VDTGFYYAYLELIKTGNGNKLNQECHYTDSQFVSDVRYQNKVIKDVLCNVEDCYSTKDILSYSKCPFMGQDSRGYLSPK